jgi:phosphoadenosine phosphosulfate reductase
VEDIIVLDLVRWRIPSIPVSFLETGYYVAQTYQYQDRIAKVWSLNLVKTSFLPQYDQGYLRIGCEPCMRIPNHPKNPRLGRRDGKKLGCGIHDSSESGR